MQSNLRLSHSEDIHMKRTALTIATCSIFTVVALSLSGTLSAAAPTSASSALKAETRAQCALKPSRNIASTPAKKRIAKQVKSISIGFTSGHAESSHHCCDANGQNCSGPVDLLTICPVITVECKQTENSCVCQQV
jgi:hypothetical protein